MHLKIMYAASYNPIKEYWFWILENKKAGRWVVSQKVYKVYKHIIELLDDEGSEWEYDPERANHAIEFIENYCRHSKGALGKRPFILELWQKALVATTFGIVHKVDRTRKYREVFLVVARKNGKSTLSAAIGLYLQVADGEAGAEIYACATKKDQAKIIWLEAKRMVKKSPVLLKRIKTLVAELSADFNDSTFKPLGRDSDTLDGLNVHGAMLDEIHAWTDDNLYDVIVDGTSAREEPLIFITTTAGQVREHVYDTKYDEAEKVINGYADSEGYHDEHFLPIIYELDNRKEWTNEKCWIKANPGLRTIKKLDQLKNKVQKAIANPRLVKNLLCKDFDMPETTGEAWLTFEQVDNREKFDIKELKPRYGIGGTDLSSTTDLTAAKVIFKVPNDERIYVMSMYWIPEELVEKRVQEDKVPYDFWIEQGYCRTCPGNKNHAKYVTEWFLEIQNNYDIYLMNVGYDAWSAVYWVEDMKNNFGDIMIPVHQGKKTLSSPMKNLGADLEKKLVIYNNNPIDKWCLMNTAIDVDKNDNIQPIKTSNPKKRIDGTAALLDAYVVLEEKLNDYMTLI